MVEIVKMKKKDLFTGEWRVLITVGKIVGIFVGAWVISFVICAIIWVFAYHYSPLFDSDKDKISILEPYFSINKLATNYSILDWEGSKYGDAEILLEDKEKNRKFLVYILREMPLHNVDIIFSSATLKVERVMRGRERFLGGVYIREVGDHYFDFVASYYKKYLFRDFMVKGAILRETKGEKDGNRYRFISGYISRIGFNDILVWIYRKVNKVLDKMEAEYPYIGVAFIVEKEEAQKLYVVTMGVDEEGKDLKVIEDFVRVYFNIDIKGSK